MAFLLSAINPFSQGFWDNCGRVDFMVKKGNPATGAVVVMVFPR
jgi:hypothetical protein